MSGKINYQAKDEIASGHVLDTYYDLTFAMEVLNDTDDFIKTINTSLSGAEETVFLRTDVMWDVTASFISKTDLDYWKEMIYSTKLGESFTFYPDSTGPGYTCVMVTKGYKPVRFGTTDDQFSFALKIKLEV